METPLPPPPTPVAPPPATLPEKPKTSVFPIIIGIAFVISLAAASLFGYLYYQEQTAPVLPIPTPLVSPEPVAQADEPTTDWPVYTNAKYLYEFKCPPTSTHSAQLNTTNGMDKPYYQEQCSEANNQVKVSVLSIKAPASIADGAEIKEATSSSGKEKIVLRGFDKNYFDQIFATFKVADQTQNIDTPNWKTYTNSKEGISFSNPDNWYIKVYPDETHPNMTFSAMLDSEPNQNPGPSYIAPISIQIVSLATDIKTYIDSETSAMIASTVKQKKIVISGIEGTQFQGTYQEDAGPLANVSIITTLFPWKSGFLLSVHTSNTALSPIYNKLLSTLKFTN